MLTEGIHGCRSPGSSRLPFPPLPPTLPHPTRGLGQGLDIEFKVWVWRRLPGWEETTGLSQAAPVSEELPRKEGGIDLGALSQVTEAD